jgi:hypothetical protein
MNHLPDDKQSVNIAIDRNLLAKMLCDQTLVAADIRCLDSSSKKQLWRLCLQAGLKHPVL